MNGPEIRDETGLKCQMYFVKLKQETYGSKASHCNETAARPSKVQICICLDKSLGFKNNIQSLAGADLDCESLLITFLAQEETFPGGPA